MLTEHLTWEALIIVGIVLHLVGDFLFQSEWMALNKAKLRRDPLDPEPYQVAVMKFNHETQTAEHVRDEIVIPRDKGSRWYDRHPAAYAHASIHAALMFIVFPLWAALLIGVLHLVIDSRTLLTRWKEVFRQTVDGPYALHVAIWQDQTVHFLVILLAACLVKV